MIKKISPFEKALIDSVLVQYESIPAEADINYQFSNKFQSEMNRLINRMKAGSYNHSGVILKRIAIGILIALMLTGCALSIPAVREAIIDFLLLDKDGHYEVVFDPEIAATAPNEIIDVYKPQWYPESYMVLVDDATPSGVVGILADESGNMICYQQTLMPRDATNGSWITINSEGVEKESVIINGYKVEVIYDLEVYTLVWTDNSYVYLLELSNNLPMEIAEHIMTSVLLVP